MGPGAQVRQEENPQAVVRTMNTSNGRQLMMRTRVRTGLGEGKIVTALVDTGAQVNLIRKNLFGEEAFVPARHPVDLRSISGDKLEGG